MNFCLFSIIIYVMLLSGCSSVADNRHAGETDTETDTNEHQSPITIAIINNSDTVKYIQSFWTNESSHPEMVLCMEGDIECFLHLPYCTMYCDNTNLEHCILDCDQRVSPPLKPLAPGEEIQTQWDGFLRYEDNNNCQEGTCFVKINPPPTEYRFFVKAYDELSCTPLCHELEDGFIYTEETIDSGFEYKATVTLPYPDDKLIISIGEDS